MEETLIGGAFSSGKKEALDTLMPKARNPLLQTSNPKPSTQNQKNLKPVNPLLLSNTLIYHVECTNQKGHCQKIDLGGFFNIKTQSLDTLMPKARAPFLGP